MSFLAPKTEMPNSMADNTPGRQARNSPTQVVPLGFGRFRVVVQWVTPVLHWQYKTNDKQTSQTAYFSCYGWVCLGPIDHVVGLIVNDRPYHGIFKSRSDYPGSDYIDHVYSKPVPEKYRIWWGNETAASPSAYINSLVRDAGHAMSGKTHPGARGICAIAVQDMEAGSSSGGQTPPLPKVELEVYRGSVAGAAYGSPAHGTHTMGIARDILTLKRGGLKLPASYFDDANWTAQMQAIMDTGVAGMVGEDLFTSFVFAEPKQADEQLSEVLSYVDGFVVERNGKLQIGFSPNDGSSLNPAALTVISQHHLAGEIDDEPGTLDGLPSQVVVTGLDMLSDPALSEASETAQVPFANRLIGEQRPPKTYNRNGFVLRRQIKSSATLYAAILANPDWEATVPILRQYAVQLDGVTPLRPGDLFILNVDQVGGMNVVVRILSRDSDTPVESVYRVRRERGTFPRPYEPVLDPRASITPAAPADLARYTVKELPPALSLVPAVTALVERPSNSVSAYEVHYAPTNSWPGQVIATLDRWAIAAVLRTTLTAVTTDVTISVDTTGGDWSYLASQSALQQRDDTLICCHGGEWFSVGTITPTGGGAYNVALKRARLDSEAEAHAIGDLFFFTYRAQLAEVRHAGFSDLYVASVYDATTATKWFKLRPSSNGGLGNLTAAFSLQIQEPDVTLDDPNLFYTFIFKRNPTAPATPTGDTPAGWSDGPPAGTDPLWMSRAVKRLDTGALVVTWTTPVRLDGESGTDGTNGLNVAPVFIYQRSASAPTLPSASATYTFATGALTGLNNGWSQTIPAGTDPLYVSTASAAATGATDTITAGEWAAAQIFAQNGTNGINGLNNAVVFIYQRSASAPTLPSASTTYTFATGGLTGLNNGWSQTIPAGSNPLYVSAATASSSGTTDAIASGEWAGAVIMAQDGVSGGGGGNSASLYIYQRAASAPTLPSASTTYTFATGSLTGLNNGWSQTIPGGTDPLYVSTATAFATGATDTITAGEWAAAQILALNGTNGGAGGNSSPVFIYQRAASSPTLPSATTTYTFATGGLTGLNNGWQQGVPTGTNPLYVAVATAFATTSTDTIAAAEWSTPVVLAENGADGNSIQVEYSVDGSTSWHSTFTGGDKYMRQRIGGGGWSAAIKIVGEDGTNGATVLGEATSSSTVTISGTTATSIALAATTGATALALFAGNFTVNGATGGSNYSVQMFLNSAGGPFSSFSTTVLPGSGGSQGVSFFGRLSGLTPGSNTVTMKVVGFPQSVTLQGTIIIQ